MADVYYQSAHNGTTIDEAVTRAKSGGTIDELLNEKQTKLTGTAGQVVGFDAYGNAEAQNSAYLPLTGGTLTGNLNGQYIVGTWLRSTAGNHMSGTPTKVCVQDASGWIYHRTLAELKTDLGVGNSATAMTVAQIRAICV